MPGERYIDQVVLDSLGIFAEFAALCIEADRLRALAIESMRHREWREFSWSVANVIGSRLAELSAAVRNVSGDDFAEARRAISEQLAQMRLLLGQFRLFASPPPCDKRPTDLVPLIKRACQRAVADLACEVETTISVPSVYVSGDARRLSDAFSELLENATDAMKEGQSSSQMIEVVTRLENGRCLIEVADTGPGVLEKNKVRIFEPLFTTHERGNGLGLAIVAETIRDHGGSISEVGVPGFGARFRLSLPTIHPPPGACLS